MQLPAVILLLERLHRLDGLTDRFSNEERRDIIDRLTKPCPLPIAAKSGKLEAQGLKERWNWYRHPNGMIKVETATRVMAEIQGWPDTEREAIAEHIVRVHNASLPP